MVRSEEFGCVLENIVWFHDQNRLEEIRQQSVDVRMMVDVGFVIVDQIFLYRATDSRDVDGEQRYLRVDREISSVVLNLLPILIVSLEWLVWGDTHLREQTNVEVPEGDRC